MPTATVPDEAQALLARELAAAAGSLDELRDAMQAFERAMGTVDRLLAENREPLDAGMRGLAEIGPAVAELRSTLGSVRAITRQLEDRPADYLLGLEPTKEFTP